MYENKEYLKSKLKEYVADVTRPSKNGSKKSYVCPICRSGEGIHKTGAFNIDERKNEWTCFSCHKHGDIFNLVGHIQGLQDFKDRYQYIANYFGIHEDNKQQSKQAQQTQVKEVVKQVEEEKEDIKEIEKRKDYIEYCNNICLIMDAYYEGRGFTEDTIRRLQLGYDNNNDLMVIPYLTDNYYYITRNKKAGEERRFDKPKGIKEPIYNCNDLFTKEVVFVTEGQLDAASLLQEIKNNKVGAVAIGGTGRNKLINAIKENNLTCTFILSLDNDKAGEDTTNKLKADLDELKVNYITAAFNYDKYAKNKDCNDLLVSNREQFIIDIQNSIAAAYELKYKELNTNKVSNLLQAFKQNVYNNTHTCIKTGFDNLDYILDGGLYNGLYFLGACSSLGKTTLLLQLADQIAAAGKDVLYFSLEMGKDELISKSISRYTYKLAEDKKHAKTTRGITDIKRYSNYTEQEKELIKRSIDEYSKEVGEHLYIYESIQRMSVEDIRNIVKRHIDLKGEKPIVFIDYLQILAAVNENTTDKRIVDTNVTNLKILSRDFNIPIICISSLNRESYSNYISMQAFKESGSIEYGSDFLLAMQPLGIERGNDKETIKNNIETFKKCKAAEERKIQLLVLKNRNGALKDTTFTYHTLFNAFKTDTDWQPISKEVKEEVKQAGILDMIYNRNIS